jgi:hypothetical protein
MVDGFRSSRRNGKTVQQRRGFSSDESGTYTNLQYWVVQRMGLARCQCGQIKTACCRFCIPIETGAPKSPVA